MGDCGCSVFHAMFKIKGAGKYIYVIDVYPSCSFCCTTAGVIIYRMDKKALKEWDCEDIPELPFNDNQIYHE